MITIYIFVLAFGQPLGLLCHSDCWERNNYSRKLLKNSKADLFKGVWGITVGVATIQARPCSGSERLDSAVNTTRKSGNL